MLTNYRRKNMNDKDKKLIDKIVWWIPFRKLRNKFRRKMLE